jgi:hypothetical protein
MSLRMVSTIIHSWSDCHSNQFIRATLYPFSVCVPVTTRTTHIGITPISHIVHFSPLFSHWIEDSFTLARLLTTARLREIASGSISRNHEIHRNCSDADEGTLVQGWWLCCYSSGGIVACCHQRTMAVARLLMPLKNCPYFISVFTVEKKLIVLFY